MPRASVLRQQIESTLCDRIPSALTRPAGTRESAASGIRPLDALLHGGFPAGAITEIVGPECSGRTALALSFIAGVVSKGMVSAWVDANDAFDPLAAAASGVDLESLLWVRCGTSQEPSTSAQVASGLARQVKDSHSSKLQHSGGGVSPHPRFESRGMSEAIATMLGAQPRSAAFQDSKRTVRVGTPSAPNSKFSHSAVDREEQVPTDRLPARRGTALHSPPKHYAALLAKKVAVSTASVLDNSVRASEVALAAEKPMRQSRSAFAKPWDIERALLATDLLLQAGGFQAIVLDLAGVPAEVAWRIPMATWFRFRAASERARAHFLLLTQHPCARSSAELVLRMHAGELLHEGKMVTGVGYRSELERQRQHRAKPWLQPTSNSNDLPFRKGPHSERSIDRVAAWSLAASWARTQ